MQDGGTSSSIHTTGTRSYTILDFPLWVSPLPQREARVVKEMEMFVGLNII